MAASLFAALAGEAAPGAPAEAASAASLPPALDFSSADLDGPVTVVSTGLLEPGRPVSVEVVTALSSYGIDIAGHRSTQLSPAAVAGADLILGMERRHAREAVLLDPGALPRAFTLKELVRRGEKFGARLCGQPLTAWLEAIADGRERTVLIGRAPDDDVDDPLGGDLAAYRATAAELADLVLRMARLLWPEAPALRPDADVLWPGARPADS